MPLKHVELTALLPTIQTPSLWLTSSVLLLQDKNPTTPII